MAQWPIKFSFPQGPLLPLLGRFFLKHSTAKNKQENSVPMEGFSSIPTHLSLHKLIRQGAVFIALCDSLIGQKIPKNSLTRAANLSSFLGKGEGDRVTWPLKITRGFPVITLNVYQCFIHPQDDLGVEERLASHRVFTEF